MTKWLIIDGYNLIHRGGLHRFGDQPGWSPRDLDSRRRHLILLLEKTVGILADRITVVFDGRSGEGPEEKESLAVEVLFSPGNKTADTVIEQLVFQAGLAGKPASAGKVVVVTSDRPERETTEAAGAETMACSVFLDQLNETLVRIERELRSRALAQHPATPLGNPFSSLDIK